MVVPLPRRNQQLALGQRQYLLHSSESLCIPPFLGSKKAPMPELIAKPSLPTGVNGICSAYVAAGRVKSEKWRASGPFRLQLTHLVRAEAWGRINRAPIAIVRSKEDGPRWSDINDARALFPNR